MEKSALKILGIRIDNLSKSEVNNWIENVCDDWPYQKFITTLNPEIVLNAHRDKKYREIINKADLNICDGFGLKALLRIKSKKIKSRYTGVELVDYTLRLAKEKNINVLSVVWEKSLSSSQEIKEAIEEKYGFQTQAVQFQNPKDFFEDKNLKEAEIVFVNFGAPWQEKFIFENRRKFPKAKILVGIGGALDFLTGKMRRAPRWMQKVGLEWFWRLLQEPKRIRRIINAVLVFPWIVLTSDKRQKK